MDKYQPIGIAAGLMMMKWELLSQHLRPREIFEPGDTVNLFISFESILRNIASQRNLNSMITFHKQSTVLDLESAILNVVANYRMYLKREGCNPRIFLYYTDLTSTEEQSMVPYNSSYRSFYFNHYLRNPECRSLGELVTGILVPEVSLILSYVPDCYFIRSTRFDGSLIPAIISERTDPRHTIVITSDSFDTLYLFREKFSVVQIKRNYGNFNVISSVRDSVSALLSGEKECPEHVLQLFNHELYYRLLLSVEGNRYRNIQTARGFGFSKLITCLTEAVDRNQLLMDFRSVDSIADIFPDKFRDDIISACRCTDLSLQLSLLTNTDRDFVCSQMIDRSDPASLESLNNRRFLDFPINLIGLLD